MTADEALKILTRDRHPALSVPEHCKKDARIIAEIVSILQEEKLTYIRASDLLQKCKDMLAEIAEI